jgi:anhydro-N-acetylmuramic acid kinase
MGELYIGLMSGTSMDGIDAAVVQFGDAAVSVLHTHQHEYPDRLRRQLAIARLDPDISNSEDVGELHRQVGQCFLDAVNQLLAGTGARATDITAIGSHGQTLRHEPNASQPFSLQIGDPDIIANGTGITTVADFRSADIELGGQGAPLTPAFHEWLFREQGTTRVVLNLGGIANITVLPGDDRDTTGFDTGPGNTLMDAWISKNKATPFDIDGNWAASGSVIDDLLSRLMADAYFAAAAPKSTGFEYFNLDWLIAAGGVDRDAANVQATLCQLTADSVAAAVRRSTQDARELLVCGGGTHNLDLMRRLRTAMPGYSIQSTASAGLDPDWVEAAAFAWLAMRTTRGMPGNLPSVTGASGEAVLGTTHPAI